MQICIYLHNEWVWRYFGSLITFENQWKMKIEIYISSFIGSLLVFAYQSTLLRYIGMLWLGGFGNSDILNTAIEN